MGLFNRKKQESEGEEQESVYTWMTLEEALNYDSSSAPNKEENIEKTVGELCDQIDFLKNQLKESKSEFQQITRYLADIERLERMSESERAEISDAARMVLSLENERVAYQTGEKKLNAVQFRIMETYEESMPGVIEELEKKEHYFELVRGDINNLEGEKGSIEYEMEQALDKKKFLVKFAYGTMFAALTVFIVLIALMSDTGKDFTVPFFITGLAVLAFVAYYVYTNGQCSERIKAAQRKLAKATILLNKVRIKYVYTANALEYAYEKYHAESLQMLKLNWENYVKAKDAEKRYRKNTQLISSYMDRLTTALNALGIEGAQAWMHQPEALIDRAVMVDFKDAIVERRNKLRAGIDYNIHQQDVIMNEIEALKRKYADREREIDSILRKYKID